MSSDARPDPHDGPGDQHDGASQHEEPEQIDLIAQAVVGVSGVHDLHAGVIGEVATYLPGRRVNGLRLREPGAEIHVVLEWGAPVRETSEKVRAAVRPFVEGPIDVTVEDVAPPAATA